MRRYLCNMVDEREIIEKVNASLAEYEIKLVDRDDRKIVDIGIDSIKLIRVIIFLEEEYGIEFDMDTLSYDSLNCGVDLINFFLQQINKL